MPRSRDSPPPHHREGLKKDVIWRWGAYGIDRRDTRDSTFLDTKGFAVGATSEPITLVEPLSMSAMVTLAEPATLTLSCVSLAPAIPVVTHPEVDVNVKVVAVQLGGITVAD